VRLAAVARVLAVAVAAVARSADAQQPLTPSVAPELRADVIAGAHPAIQFGAGAQIPLGYYVRVGIVGALGASIGEREADAPDQRLDGRLDVLARFLLDPFRQSRFGFSVGGGMSVRAEPGEIARPLLLVAVDLEGRRARSGLVPALQVGLGGGARVGIVLRHGAPSSR
jgi:hypothetical protein